jgi:peptide/nickel transport system permease protein
MILVSFLAFAAFHIISGDPARAILGMNATEKQLELMRHELGLDKPFIVQYFSWLLGFFSGNLGISYSYRQPVASLIAPKLKVTLLMVLISFAIIVIFSLPLGLRAAQKSGSRLEWLRTTINQLCMAVPAFFLSILVSYVFGIVLKFFTPGDFPRMEHNLLGALCYLFFAAVCIAIPRIAMAVRMLKSTLVEEMEKDYVRTAISRGNDRTEVLKKHVLKNSLVPTITFLGQTMAEIVGGSIVVEQVFGIPGMGRFLVASISNRDYPVVEALVVILAFWVILSGTIADLINQKIDPRLKLGGRE